MKDKKPSKELVGWVITGLGICGTVAYLFLLDWLVNGRWMEIRAAKLNDLGDFLAGAFGPLAIWWLVLGYFQQGIELRQNSAALKQQADELAHSVAEQRKLAETAQQQLDTHKEELDYQKRQAAALALQQKRRAQPTFNFFHYSDHVEGTTQVFGLKISNNGSLPCTLFEMHFDQADISSFRFDRLDPGKPVDAFIRLSPSHLASGEFEAHVSYYDANGEFAQRVYLVVVPNTAQILFRELDE